jgi:hypothetical protein
MYTFIDVYMSSTIFIKTATRERLKHIGIKGQTYDDLINQLVDMKDASQRSTSVNRSDPTEEVSDIPKNDNQLSDASENHVCDLAICSRKATDTIMIKIGDLGEIPLFFCRDCVAKFQEV